MNPGGNNVQGNNPQQSQQGNNQQQNPAGSSNEPGNVNNPNAGANDPNATNGQGADPFAKFSKMFDNSATQADAPPAFSIDPKIMSDIAGQQDFMKGLNPELMQRATSGDMTAMMEIIHQTARNAYRTSIEHGGMLTDKFVGAREAHSAKGFGSRVKGELTQASLATTPNFKHPVVRQQLSEIASRLSVQHPDASPQEIADMSKEYITQLSEALNPKDPKAASNTGNFNFDGVEERGEEYWDKYFSQDSPMNRS
jgi:hypothetical protein